MALPAIVGISWLAGILIKVLAWVTSKYALRLGARLAAGLAWVTMYLAMLVALAAVFGGILVGVVSVMPPSLGNGIAYIKPANFEFLMGAYFSARSALWIFNQKKELMRVHREMKYYVT